MAGRDSITGVWQGLYTYLTEADMPESHFTATLIEAGGLVSGTIHEVMNRYRGGRTPANATVEGRREDSRVVFMKSYNGVGGLTHQVHYDGVLDEAGYEIEGHWTIYSLRSGRFEGRFLMVRNRPLAEAAKAEAFEKA